jgi:hypothetical protein
MRAPNWQILNKEDAQQYPVNTCRALLTRARAGTVICVLHCDDNDPAQRPSDLNGIFEALKSAGCPIL